MAHLVGQHLEAPYATLWHLVSQEYGGIGRETCHPHKLSVGRQGGIASCSQVLGLRNLKRAIEQLQP